MTLCFESEQTKQLFELCSPAQPSAIYSLTDFVRATGWSPTENPLGILKSMLPKSSKLAPERILLTIEYLRHSRILTHQDIDYCFSLLPQTPKNKIIADTFHLYLDSELARDLPGKIWELVEFLKSSSIDLNLSDHLVFVPKPESTFSFQEFAKSFYGQKQIEKIEMLPFSHLGSVSGSPQERPYYQGTSSECLHHIVNEIKANHSKPGSLHIVGLLAEPHEIRRLSLQLSANNIPYQNHIDSLTKPIPPVALEDQWIHTLRTLNEISLSERLKIGHYLVNDAFRPKAIDWDDYLDKLVSQKVLDPENKSLVANALSAAHALMEHSPQTPKPLPASVHLVELESIPSFPNTHFYTYMGQRALEAESPPVLLDSLEIEVLNQQGFPLADAIENQRLKSKNLKLLFEDSSLLGWNSGSIELPFKLDAVTFPQPHTSLPTHVATYQAELPEKPLSATQLEAFKKCPSLYFLNNRLRLEPARKKWENRYALLLGIGTHDALENYLQQGDPLPPPDQWDSTKLLTLFKDSILTQEPFLKESNPTYIMLEHNFLTFVDSVKPIEETLTQLSGPRSVLAVEQAFDFILEGIRVRGKIDRIDRLSDGSLLVLDYKTGKVDFSPNHLASGTNFQALLYLLAAENLYPSQTVQGILFYDLKAGEVKRGVIREATLSKEQKALLTRGHALKEDKLESLKSSSLDHLKSIKSELESGNYPPLPSTKVCSFCHYGSFCRGSALYV